MLSPGFTSPAAAPPARSSAEYRTPTDTEWEEFLGHFQRRKVSLGTCGRAYNTGCGHEHACIRCPMLQPDPTQRPRLVEVRDNLRDRITEARDQGWLGEIEGLKTSLAAADTKLTDLDRLTTRRTTVHLGMPTIDRLVSRTATPGRDLLDAGFPGPAQRSTGSSIICFARSELRQ